MPCGYFGHGFGYPRYGYRRRYGYGYGYGHYPYHGYGYGLGGLLFAAAAGSSYNRHREDREYNRGRSIEPSSASGQSSSGSDSVSARAGYIPAEQHQRQQSEAHPYSSAPKSGRTKRTASEPQRAATANQTNEIPETVVAVCGHCDQLITVFTSLKPGTSITCPHCSKELASPKF
mmetsp:Transcript_9882/g.36186  ORF Transcript_9882/g.36186 Transcript_9882/m.36186 type:complete len:175 (-) Transcript_9882:219-743(-)